MDPFKKPHPLQLDFSKPPRRNNVLLSRWRACYQAQRKDYPVGHIMSTQWVRNPAKEAEAGAGK